MDKAETRVVIKYFVTKRWKASEIHKEMQYALEDPALPFTTVHKLMTEFKNCRDSLEDNPWSGRPKIATTPEIVGKVHYRVMQDLRLNIFKIVRI